MALATSVNDLCNVRIVNFYYNPDTKRIYFTSFKDNAKIVEFQKNNHIAFTTIPHQGTQHVKGTGVVSKSDLALNDVKDCFIQEIPDYKELIEMNGDDLVLFEVTLKTLVVTLDYEHIEPLDISHL